MFGIGVDVGYGGCEPRVEGIVQGTKRYCTILRKLELMFMKHYAPNRCLYIKVAKLRTGVGSAEMSHLQIAVSKYQGRCEQRSEVFVKPFFFFFFFFEGGGGVRSGGGGGGGSQGGCEQRIEVFVKIKKKKFGWVGLGRGGGGGGGSGWMFFFFFFFFFF